MRNIEPDSREYEQPQIPPHTENPMAWSHEEIVDAFKAIHGSGLGTLMDFATSNSGAFEHAGRRWAEALADFRAGVNAALGLGWSGRAADESARAIDSYLTDAGRLEAYFTDMNRLVGDAFDAVHEAKNAIWDSRTSRSDAGPMSIDEFTEWIGQADAEEEARVQMAAKYVLPFARIDSTFPVLPTPIEVLDRSDHPTSGGLAGQVWKAAYAAGASGTHDGASVVSVASTGNVENTASNPVEAPGDLARQPTGATEPSASPAGFDTEDPARYTSPATVPAVTAPAAVGLPSRQPTADMPFVPPTTTYRPTADPLPGLPVANSDGPATGGRSVAGTAPVPAPSVTNSSPAGTSVRGTPGGMPMMPPGAAASRGGQDDNAEHKTPEYLLSRHNTDELLGETPPTIAGGVLGANFAAAQFPAPPRAADTSRTTPGVSRD